MCTKVTCRSCGLASWTGCGAHVEAVLRGVPEDQRCRCRSQPAGARRSREGRRRWWSRRG